MSPLGGLQSAGHRRCAMGVLDWLQIPPDLSQMANLKSQALYARQRSYIPLSLSLPRSEGIIGARPKIFAFCVLFANFGRFFCLRERASKTITKKHRKKAKIEDFGLPKPFQNPSEMPSKSMSHKTCIFSSNFCLFWQFRLCALFVRSA